MKMPNRKLHLVKARSFGDRAYQNPKRDGIQPNLVALQSINEPPLVSGAASAAASVMSASATIIITLSEECSSRRPRHAGGARNSRAVRLR
jgi:hypothetical protein